MKKGLLVLACVLGLAVVFLVFLGMPAGLFSQSSDPTLNSNPPPFDFNDAFYSANGISLSVLNSAASARFGAFPSSGLFRLTGPPAGPGQQNWVVDNSNTDPTRNNIRILATTGGYKDDDGSPNQFISIIAFALSSDFFTNNPDARGNKMVTIVNNFEAYVGLKQNVNGVLAPTPCGSLHDPTLAATPCFPVVNPDGTPAVATPGIRQDWRFSTNRTRLDASAPFGYFCDDILGMWIITYFWYTQFAVGGVSSTGQTITPTATCQNVLAAAAKQNGTNLDGTPIIHTGSELHFLEGVAVASEGPQFGLPLSAQPPPTAPCGAEGNLQPNGSDRGAVWLVCPAIPDPTNGAILPDAFLDSVKKPDGTPLDPRITANFNCLQTRGTFAPCS